MTGRTQTRAKLRAPHPVQGSRCFSFSHSTGLVVHRPLAIPLHDNRHPSTRARIAATHDIVACYNNDCHSRSVAVLGSCCSSYLQEQIDAKHAVLRQVPAVDSASRLFFARVQPTSRIRRCSTHMLATNGPISFMSRSSMKKYPERGSPLHGSGTHTTRMSQSLRA